MENVKCVNCGSENTYRTEDGKKGGCRVCGSKFTFKVVLNFQGQEIELK